jgi:uncharacterized membrane protein HdeD (DUF308 family)
LKEVKQFGKSYVLMSVLYVVLGAVLMAWPSTSVRMICYGLGFALVVLGITYGIIYFTRDNQEGFLQMDLAIGIVCLAFGVFILLNPTFLQTVMPIAMGIILLLGAVVKIQNALNMRRLRVQRWYLLLICALLIIALAIVLLLNVLQQEHVMVLYIGGCLLFDGMANLVSLVCIHLRMRKLTKLQKENPEVPLHDLLEQEEQKRRAEVVVRDLPVQNKEQN